MFQKNSNFSEIDKIENIIKHVISENKKVPDNFEISQVLFYSLIQKQDNRVYFKSSY